MICSFLKIIESYYTCYYYFRNSRYIYLFYNQQSTIQLYIGLYLNNDNRMISKIVNLFFNRQVIISCLVNIINCYLSLCNLDQYFSFKHYGMNYLILKFYHIYSHVNLHVFINTFYDNIFSYRNVIRNKYFQYLLFYIISIFLLAFKLYNVNCSYFEYRMFIGFYKIMQEHFIYISKLQLWWSLILYFMPGQWCFYILANSYYDYNEYLSTNLSLFEYVR